MSGQGALEHLADHEFERAGRRVDGDLAALEVGECLERAAQVGAQAQRVGREPIPLARARHADADRQPAGERVEQAGAHAAAGDLQLIGRERQRRLRRRREALKRQSETDLGEIALLDADIKRRVGENAEIADGDGLCRCRGGRRRGHHGRQNPRQVEFHCLRPS
jgi:hypothetical protein